MSRPLFMVLANHILRYRVFNTGSPYNVPTSAAVNLDALVAHYKEENRKMAEKVANKTEQQRFAAQL